MDVTIYREDAELIQNIMQVMRNELLKGETSMISGGTELAMECDRIVDLMTMRLAQNLHERKPTN